jgi:hypothetical protein
MFLHESASERTVMLRILRGKAPIYRSVVYKELKIDVFMNPPYLQHVNDFCGLKDWIQHSCVCRERD